MAWFDAILRDGAFEGIPAAVRARALADRVLLVAMIGWDAAINDQAHEALAIARDCGDPALLARALAACGLIALDSREAKEYRAEAIGLARQLGDALRLSHILSIEALVAAMTGDITTSRVAAQEGCELAETIDYRAGLIRCRYCLGMAELAQGDLAGAIASFNTMGAAAETGHYSNFQKYALAAKSMALAWQGDDRAARAAANAAHEGADELGSLNAGMAYTALGIAALAAGDISTAQSATDLAGRHAPNVPPVTAALFRTFKAQAELAGADLAAARRAADEAVRSAAGPYSVSALCTRARIALAQQDLDQAERDVHDALALAAKLNAYLELADILESLASVASMVGSHRQAVRLFGAAYRIRQPPGPARFKVWEAGYETSVAALRNTLDANDFESAWAEGAAMSTEEAIAYARRGRGERKRPTTGWASLTPTELDVVRLVSDGLGNKDIAARLFVSPRTVQTHLTHVYTKLGLASRVQLVQEAARHD